MKKLVLAIALTLIALFAWQQFGITPEKAVRKRLSTMAKVASFNSSEAPLARLSNAQKLSMFCTPDVQITVDMPRGSQRTLSGRPEILEAVAAIRSSLNGLTVEFLDIQVVVGSGKTSAVAELTARARAPGDREDYIQELRFTLVKTDGEWFISRIETVKTFSRFQRVFSPIFL